MCTTKKPKEKSKKSVSTNKQKQIPFRKYYHYTLNVVAFSDSISLSFYCLQSALSES